jgi:protein involved in polysaccharide export with SLBB domain
MGDPGAQGYYKPTPTTIPILDRIDIIEDHVALPKFSKVTSADLMPSDLTYKINPGDVVDLKIYGLYQSNQHYPVTRRVDEGGNLRVPEIGDVMVAGLTAQAAQDLITKDLGKKVTHPSVQLDLIDHTGFRYTVYGELARWGAFTLQDPDLRLVDVLALAGGVPQSTRNIYVIRQLPMSDSVLPSWERDDGSSDSKKNSNQTIQPKIESDNDKTTTPNIEDLINKLDIGGNQKESPEESPKESQKETTSDEEQPNFEEEPTSSTNPEIEALINQLDIGDDSDATPHSVSPGIIQTGKHELIDVDDLVPPREVKNKPVANVPVDVDTLTTHTPMQTKDSAYIYVPESDTWIAVNAEQSKKSRTKKPKSEDKKDKSKILERIIEIPWLQLKQGDSSYNIVIRPEDRIYVKGAPLGNLYIRGEIGRPGVFDYPNTGEKITLSEFITSAGDLGPIAVAEKISLTRRIGDDQDLQATVTLNYAAIIQRTEPDIFLKPNDHISIGTTWGATPMAIIRNGFRTTYGFGFLLDRNFGNDVFGRPP